MDAFVGFWAGSAAGALQHWGRSAAVCPHRRAPRPCAVFATAMAIREEEHVQSRDVPSAAKDGASAGSNGASAGSNGVANGAKFDAVASGSPAKENGTPNAPSPAMVWDKVTDSRLVDRLRERDITEMTPVQESTYDVIIEGRDVIARSRTGTGKTLAFGLPIIERLRQWRDDPDSPVGTRRGRGPTCVVMAPTRELAKQVSSELDRLASVLSLRTECFYGGVSYTVQENALQRGIDILVGTPGRVIDHLERGNLLLDNVRCVVLDEADEMLSMGFAEEIERVFEHMPPVETRQTVLFSATVPSWVKSMARKQQRDPFIYDAIGRAINKTATTVRHCAIRVPADDGAKAAFLDDIITTYGGALHQSRCLVFTQTKKEADELVMSGAIQSGAAVLHGDVSQRQREITLAHFRAGRFPVLVATDVAARGLDISGIDVVIQFSVPQDIDSYIHRAGRTGRAGRSGVAVIMHSDRETEQLRRVERTCGIKFERMGPPSAAKVLESAAEAASTCLPDVEDNVVKYFLPKADELLQNEDPKLVLAAALALVARRSKYQERSILTGETNFTTLQLQTKIPLQPQDVLRCVRKAGGVSGATVKAGKISMCSDDTRAVFDYPTEDVELLLEGAETLRGMRIEAVQELPPLRSSYAGSNYDRRPPRSGSFRGARDREDFGSWRGGPNRRRGPPPSSERNRTPRGGDRRDRNRPGSRRSYGGYGGYGRHSNDNDDFF